MKIITTNSPLRLTAQAYQSVVQSISLSLLTVSVLFVTGCKNGTDDPRDHVGQQLNVSQSSHSRNNPTAINEVAPPRRIVTLVTADNWKIIGDYYPQRGAPTGAVVLLHERDHAATDWRQLCEGLAESGIAALAIDQRGAGRSSRGPAETGKNAPWNTQPDIDAACKYLLKESKTFDHHIGLVGASYGANNALIYAAAHADLIQSIALFSPGLDYNGLDAMAPAKVWAGPMYLVYSLHDPIAGLGPEQIRDNCPARDKETNQFDDDKHGTELLNSTTVEYSIIFFGRTLK